MKRWQTADFYGGDNNEGSHKHTETLTSYYRRGRQRLIQMRPRSEIKNLSAKKICTRCFFFLPFLFPCGLESLGALHLSIDIKKEKEEANGLENESPVELRPCQVTSNTFHGVTVGLVFTVKVDNFYFPSMSNISPLLLPDNLLHHT